MKNIFIGLLVLLSAHFYSQNGGVNIGGGTANHSSAILQVENFDNKGVLFPQVELLDDLKNATSPILNPINGMIVYNKGGANFHGYYYWDVDQWKLMGDSGNVVTDAVYRVMTPFTALGGIAVGSYQIPSTTNWAQFSNNISGLVGTPSGTFTLPPGYYAIHVNANIDIPTLNPAVGVAGYDVHLIKMMARLFDGATTIYGEQTSDNSVVRTGAHTFSTNFDFSFNVISPITVKLALGMDAGGTYYYGAGGTGINNGAITIKDISIHFQKTTLDP